jgi:hypothetical protein
LVEKSKFKTDWKGGLLGLESGEKFCYNFLFNFSLQHLAYEINSKWIFKVGVLSSNEKVIKRAKNIPTRRQSYLKKVKLKEVSGKIVSADIKFFYNELYSGKINIEYGKDD